MTKPPRSTAKTKGAGGDGEEPPFDEEIILLQ